MIKGITQSGRYSMVSGGMPSSTFYQNGQPMAGMVRYYNNELEVYDGNMWHRVANSYATVGLTPEAEELLDWAKQKRNEELDIQLQAKNNPAVKVAYENLKRAEEQLKITTILSKDEEQTTS